MVLDAKLFEVKNISFSYDGDEIFSDISFSIDRGDVLCILGPNGTGKTTLIKCLIQKYWNSNNRRQYPYWNFN